MQPSCGGGFDPVVTRFRALENGGKGKDVVEWQNGGTGGRVERGYDPVTSVGLEKDR